MKKLYRNTNTHTHTKSTQKVRNMKVPVKAIFLGGGVFVGGTFVAFNIFASNNELKKQHQHEVEIINNEHNGACCAISEQSRRVAFNSGATMYDEDIGTDEMVMGLPLIRRFFIGWNSQGRVLEIAAGTGRNLKYYDFDKVSLTSLDCSKEMNDIAEAKAKQLKVPKKRFQSFVMDGEKLKFPDNTFDTIVDTFGLCSFENPDKVLKEMQRVCKKNGQILLLEHGKSHYDWLNNILDSNVVRHAERWGCIWNRDINKLIEDSQMEIKDVTRWHFGTTYVIKGKPSGIWKEL